MIRHNLIHRSWSRNSRAGGACGDEGLDHVVVLKTELGYDGKGLVEAGEEQGCAEGSAGK